MNTVLFWFRHDLRLHDQSALHAACQLGAQHLLPVVCLPDVQATTAWGFARTGAPGWPIPFKTCSKAYPASAASY